jgi:CheY-like chemotaxis protein
MGKILVLGNEQTRKWSENINYSHFIPMDIFSLGEDGERKLCEWVINNIPNDSKAIVVDVDGISTPELCLAFAMTLRLSIFEKRIVALSPILFVSRATQDDLLGYKYTPIILTGSIAFDQPENVNDAIEAMHPLSPEEYRTEFLDIIKILPNAKEGTHSLANQWGADVLSRITIGNETNNELIKKARLSLYFRYVRALSLKTKDIEAILNDSETQEETICSKLIDATGKNILLIDDEADKGWDDVLRKMLPNSEFKTIKEEVPNYENFSDDAKKTIESGKYDLIFLDLRMNGVAEEETLRPNDFSGMKILNNIKKLNKGNQVIMFTASNKAWNMKALLDAGADGYYIKESPEYAFPTTYSISNANEFVKTINRCLRRGYLRDVAGEIKQFKKNETSFKYDDKLFCNISVQLDVAYSLISSAIAQQQFAFAYISLEQVFEIISDELIVLDNYHYIIDETQEDCKDWVIDSRGCRGKINLDWKDYPQWKKIASLYYQLWNGTDVSFGKEVQQLIEKRNAFIHNDKTTLNKTDSQRRKIHTDIYREDGFIRLFQAVKTILQHMY